MFNLKMEKKNVILKIYSRIKNHATTIQAQNLNAMDGTCDIYIYYGILKIDLGGG